MNNGLTKINISQLQNLINVMDSTGNSCDTAISGYEAAINTLINSEQIQGNAINIFEENLTTIKNVKNQFSAYCEEVKKAINVIIEKVQTIDAKYSKQYEELLSMNPLDFNSKN